MKARVALKEEEEDVRRRRESQSDLGEGSERGVRGNGGRDEMARGEATVALYMPSRVGNRHHACRMPYEETARVREMAVGQRMPVGGKCRTLADSGMGGGEEGKQAVGAGGVSRRRAGQVGEGRMRGPRMGVTRDAGQGTQYSIMAIGNPTSATSLNSEIRIMCPRMGAYRLSLIIEGGLYRRRAFLVSRLTLSIPCLAPRNQHNVVQSPGIPIHSKLSTNLRKGSGRV